MREITKDAWEYLVGGRAHYSGSRPVYWPAPRYCGGYRRICKQEQCDARIDGNQLSCSNVPHPVETGRYVPYRTPTQPPQEED